MYRLHFVVSDSLSKTAMRNKTIDEIDTSMEELQYVYPTKLLYEFSKRAVNHYENGKQVELLCYIVGYKEGNTLIGTELVFPFQKNDNSLTFDWDKIDKGQ